GLGGVADELLEHGEIVEKAAAPDPGQATTGVRTIALIALGDLDQAGFLEHLEMTAEVAVCEPAELLEIGEGQALGMRHERSQEPEPGPLVNDPVETVIGERRVARFSRRHRFLRTRSGE